MVSEWGLTPRQSIEIECQRRSEKLVAEDCVAILEDRGIDEATLLVLAGPAAAAVLAGEWGGLGGYWPRVWALRGLLYAWDPGAVDAVIKGASDSHWRVREMAAKVVARRRLDDGLEAMVLLADDDVARVREAAARALIRLAGDGA